MEIPGCEYLKKFEPSLEQIAALKPSLVSFSGDKLLGGTQAGIIFGKAQYITKLKQNQLLRMLRVDKFTLCMLEALLCAYLKGEYEKIPTAKMLLQTKEQLKHKAQKLLAQIPPIFKPQIIETKSYIGGGAMPNKPLDSYGIALKTKDEKQLESFLRKEGIIARLEDKKVILEIIALFTKDFETISTTLLKAHNAR